MGFNIIPADLNRLVDCISNGHRLLFGRIDDGMPPLDKAAAICQFALLAREELIDKHLVPGTIGHITEAFK